MAGLTRRWLLVLALGALLAGAIVWRVAHDRPLPATSSSIEPLAYVGSDTCASCHAAAYAAWRDSQHAKAMAPATDRTVLGRFDGRTFRHGTITSKFFRRDGRFIVRTDGPDGTVRDFEVTHTFGVFPLQQYLIELPGGRRQALGIAWDARPEAAGGQRWFHLYPDEVLKTGDPLHWTGLAQNWNFMCADCHSTNVRKGYNAASRTFHTTWSEISVGCEACHGPASAHVAWARLHGAVRDGSYLTSPLKGARGQWNINPASGLPARTTPRANDAEIEVCARCHSRRSQMTDVVRAGDPLEAAFRPSLLETPFFSADGQMRDEVYNYASFLESRMYAHGVTCADCHDPHGGTLRLPGNATCTQCHIAAKYDSPAHHGHRAGTAAAACSTCHMPSRTYMIVDVRHDHSFRVPRPDRSAALGSPDVCTTACHRDRGAQWAADILKQRTGRIVPGFQQFAEAFGAVDRGAIDAANGLVGIVDDRAAPAIVRASALERLARRDEPFDVSRVARAFADPSPLVRRAALEALRAADDGARLQYAPSLLNDPMRSVRSEAVVHLAPLADRLGASDRAAFDRAFDEYVAEQQFNADRPEAQANLGSVRLARGQLEAAAAAFEEALRLDPTLTAAAVDLSDAQRLLGREDSAERTLREALVVRPRAAEVHHALGLSLVRQHRRSEALAELAKAASLDSDVPRYAYVLAVALNDGGDRAKAAAVVSGALARHPTDPDLRDLARQLAR